MPTFPCTIGHGHGILRDNGLVMLVDTGSPSTIHLDHQLALMGKSFHATTGHGPTSIGAIGALAGIEGLNTLFGNDVLRHFKVMFDYSRGEI